MRALGKYWMMIFGVLLLLAALTVYLFLYRPARREYDLQAEAIDMNISVQQIGSGQNTQYAAVRDQLPEAADALEKSRDELYGIFPVELREEDQILYILELEELFGTEIDFDFGKIEPVAVFSDGACLMTLTLAINYETTYQGFKDMVEFLSNDSNITSVRYADMTYSSDDDALSGTVTIQRYLIDRTGTEYQTPEIAVPDEIGKDNIFN